MTAIFETMRVREGRIPFLDRHVTRMQQAVVALGLPPLPPDTADQLTAQTKAAPDGALRVEWGGQTLGIAVRELPKSGPLTLNAVREPHPGYPQKSVERRAFDRALAAAALAGAGEALLCTADGIVAETARFAIGWLDASSVAFPPLTLNVLPSIGRGRVAEVAGQMGLGMREERVTAADLAGRVLILTNAVRGVVPVASFGGSPVPADPRVAELAKRFWT
jgi:branched-subunit amino acid aminotransferase/4-amino-4-deoxychorismate lyase